MLTFSKCQAHGSNARYWISWIRKSDTWRTGWLMYILLFTRLFWSKVDLYVYIPLIKVQSLGPKLCGDPIPALAAKRISAILSRVTWSGRSHLGNCHTIKRVCHFYWRREQGSSDVNWECIKELNAEEIANNDNLWQFHEAQPTRISQTANVNNPKCCRLAVPARRKAYVQITATTVFLTTWVSSTSTCQRSDQIDRHSQIWMT